MAEYETIKYITNLGYKIGKWEDLNRISNDIKEKVVIGKTLTSQELDILYNGIMDKWDLEIGGFKIDIKTENTDYYPGQGWGFALRGDQMSKPWLNHVISCFLTKDFHNLNIIGAVPVIDVRKIPLTNFNKKTGYAYNYPNHEVPLSWFTELDVFLKYYIPAPEQTNLLDWN